MFGIIKRIINKNKHLKRLYYIRDNYSEVDYDYIKSEIKNITENFTSEEKEMLYGTLPIIVDRLISYLENYYITIGKGY